MRAFQRKSEIVVIVSLFIILMMGGVAFAEGGIITGKVTRSDGKTPIEGAKVRAYGVGTDRLEDYPESHYGSARTKSSGEYLIGNIIPGGYTVLVTLSGYVESTKRNISVASNKVTENINFILIEEATISGKVTELDGVTPIPGVRVSIDGSDKTVEGATTTDDEGKYQIDQILSDKYWIRAMKDDYVMQVTLPTSIEVGQKISDLNFQLEKAATMAGKIMIENTTVPVEGAVVFAASEGKAYDHDSSDIDGDYLLQGLPSGAYHIVIRAKEYLPFIHEMNIVTGETITNKNFYIQPAE